MSGTLPQGAFDTIANLLKARSGLAIGRDKLYLLDTRLAPILKRHELREVGSADLVQVVGCSASPRAQQNCAT